MDDEKMEEWEIEVMEGESGKLGKQFGQTVKNIVIGSK